MTFKKGLSGNPTGRPIGANDKCNKEIRDAYNDLIRGNLSNIGKWLSRVAETDPGKAIDLLLKLSKFVIPEMRFSEIDATIEEKPKQVISWGDQKIEI